MAKEFAYSYPIQGSSANFNYVAGSKLATDLSPESKYKRLVEQCRSEWEYCWRTQNGKVQKWLNRLRLYNNQKRDDDAVGDNTLFTIHNSVLSSLYTDELTIEWVGRNEGNEDIATNLQNLSSYDQDEMKKATLDYYWWWDTLFFGKGFVSLYNFDRKRMVPSPALLDPVTFQQDPEAIAINGDMNGEGAARFLGNEILQTKYQMERIPSIFDLDYIKIGKSTRSLIDQARQSRQDAAGLNQQIRTEEKDLGQNAYYQITQWFTHFKDDELTGGKTKKVLVWLANDRSKVIRFKVLNQQNKWGIIERSIFPSSHEFYGTSVTDLVEDKQRMKAILTNLGINLVKSDLFGMYLYDRGHIKNRADLNFDFNKFVGVDLDKGESIANVIQPMARQTGNQAYFNLIMNILDTAAQKSTATPDMLQGQPSRQDRTATELNKVDQNAVKRYSLASRIGSWSEKEFWEQYYYLYKTFFKSGIDEKIVRVQGMFSPTYPVFKREMIIGKTDPDVFVKSKFVSSAERDRNRQLMNDYSQALLQDPTVNRRYLLKKLGKLHELKPEEIEQLLPPTPDELKAREENVTLNDDKPVQVKAGDKHEEHLIEHAKARPTASRHAHVATHRKAIEMQKSNPEMFPGLQNNQNQQQQQNQGMQNVLQTMNNKSNQGRNQNQMRAPGGGMQAQ
ncbi:MAG: hypothetical protein KGJ07_07475 [Patescibacteria group bacterium]|nr:hypothetical protein [Patescibacteria group bacterium]